MKGLGQIIEALEKHRRSVARDVQRARTEPGFRRKLLQRWKTIRQSIGEITTPTGLKLPRLALPQTDEPGEIARYLLDEGLPGEFPFANGAYREMYAKDPQTQAKGPVEEPTRLFAGLGLAEDPNARVHFLTRHQKSIRLSTAFDGPTLYGLDSDADGVFGKIGEGGVAIDTVEDMDRLYANFPLGDRQFSASMTINGPAPILLAMYVAAARRRFGDDVVPRLRGTVQADVLKEVQAQNELLFPVDASLRFLANMVEYTTERM